jgi:hypothetical protein
LSPVVSEAEAFTVFGLKGMSTLHWRRSVLPPAFGVLQRSKVDTKAVRNARILDKEKQKDGNFKYF